MRLSATISIYGGGTGSGCNPKAGKCGRPSLGLRSGESTQDKYKDVAGNYTAERSRLHEKVIDEMIGNKTTPVGRAPIAYVLGGGTASGKTTASREILGGQPSFLRVDPDELKTKIPEYAQLKKEDPEHAAFRVHEESSDLTKKLMSEAIARKLDLTYDSTTSGKGSTAMIDSLIRHGYHVHLLFVDVPIDEARKRAALREKQSTDPMNLGRHVPDSVIKESHQRSAQNFMYMRDIPELKSVSLYDNTTKPKLVYFRPEGGGSTIYDKEIFNRYRQKARGEI